MRTKIVFSLLLLFAAFSALSGAQVVVTEDASTWSLAQARMNANSQP
ncbi:MAG: hypothetical protein WA830_23880 [Candidatus Sulfotelmatobacter sp.]